MYMYVLKEIGLTTDLMLHQMVELHSFQYLSMRYHTLSQEVEEYHQSRNKQFKEYMCQLQNIYPPPYTYLIIWGTLHQTYD